MSMLLTIPLGILAGLVGMSLAEYLIHRWIMHRPFPWARSVFLRHAVQHHGRCFRDRFDFDPEPECGVVSIRIGPWPSVFLGGAIALLIALASIPAALAFWSVCIAHHWAWDEAHAAMHGVAPRPRLARLPVYRYIARYHLLHHLHPLTNYNALLPPLADLVFGTYRHPDAADRAAIQEAGL